MINQASKFKDRIGTFGASDTHFIMGNWDTATFLNWWQSKLGIKDTSFTNVYVLAGTYKEHQIADWYEQKFNVKLFFLKLLLIKWSHHKNLILGPKNHTIFPEYLCQKSRR